MEVALVPASEDDSDFVYEANREAMASYVAQVWGCWDEVEQLAFHRAGFNPEAGWFLIEVGGERVGVVQYQVDHDELWLGRITILPRHQGRGVGTSVIESLRNDHRGKLMGLRVLQVNIRAQELYARLGFRVTRRDEPHVYMQAPPRS